MNRALFFCAALCACSPLPAADAWQPIKVPSAWEEAGVESLATHDGFAWYRCFVDVPEKWRDQRLLLVFGEVDDVDEGYFNGHKLGANGSMPPNYQPPASRLRRPYVIDPAQIRYGEPNLIALRVYDSGGRGGIRGGPVQLVAGDEAIDLAGSWQIRAGDDAANANWPAKPGSDEAQAEVAAYRAAVGDRPAGFAGIVAVDEAARKAMFDAVESKFRDNRNPHALVDDKGPPRSPQEALAALHPAEGLAVDLIAAEPDVAQPVASTFDERGRLWVVQYIQYPLPAGLKVVSYDEHLRAVFDRVPPPPPHHIRGADKITIHEDADGDGTFERVKTFVEGLNITTSVLLGRGGVWVLNPPYLLFYPDANRDDVPDGDPVVHLSGFGLEDTHAVANSLAWGPDGWIYGGQGSTTTARVRAELSGSDATTDFLGQAVWRYHPESHRFEIFAEGGHNTFGVDFDDVGRVFSGTNASPRGHYFVQGAYHSKGFGKHGPHTNPYAFGFFNAMDHTGDQTRLTHQFVLYGGAALPERYNGKMLSVNPLDHWLMSTRLEPAGSTFRTVDEHKILTSDDPWFRPVHIQTGPDGALYICDWYDARITHLDPKNNWDHERGRIYRLRSTDYKPVAPFDLASKSGDELVDLLEHPNRWYRETARRVMADHKVGDAAGRLGNYLYHTGQLGLESLWAMHAGWLLEPAQWDIALSNANPHVRAWAVRLACDGPRLSDASFQRLVSPALQNDLVVRNQLAASARRLPAEQAIPLVGSLLSYDSDASDPYQPLLLWWAVEAHCARDSRAVVEMFEYPAVWQCPLVANHLVERLMRRFAAAGTPEDLARCAELLRLAPDAASVNRLMSGFEAAYEGRPRTALPAELTAAIAAAGGDTLLVELRSGAEGAVERALQVAADRRALAVRRLDLLRAFGQTREPRCVPVLIGVACDGEDTELARVAALGALARYDDRQIAAALLQHFGRFHGAVAAAAQTTLAGRAEWAEALLRECETGRIGATSLLPGTIDNLRLHREPRVSELCLKLFGQPTSAPPDEILAEIERVQAIARSGESDVEAGRVLFARHCGKCHVLFGEGGQVGPDLTGAKRGDLQNMLLQIVSPSAAIREGFVTYTVATTDGRVLTGLVVRETPEVVELRTAEAQTISLPRADIEEMAASPKSLMPEGAFKDFTDQELRDLLAFFRLPAPSSGPK